MKKGGLRPSFLFSYALVNSRIPDAVEKI